MQTSSAHRRLAQLPSRQNGYPRELQKIGLLRIALAVFEHFSNEGDFCSARVRQAGTRGTRRAGSTRVKNLPRLAWSASDRPFEEGYTANLARVALALRVACKFKAIQTLGEFKNSLVHKSPMPNTSVELTRYGIAPGPRGAYGHLAPRGPGAMPPRSAHLQR